ncbi:MAG: hypothetical protein U0Z17_11355 [Bacteroidales bacterium]
MNTAHGIKPYHYFLTLVAEKDRYIYMTLFLYFYHMKIEYNNLYTHFVIGNGKNGKAYYTSTPRKIEKYITGIS